MKTTLILLAILAVASSQEYQLCKLDISVDLSDGTAKAFCVNDCTADEVQATWFLGTAYARLPELENSNEMVEVKYRNGNDVQCRVVPLASDEQLTASSIARQNEIDKCKLSSPVAFQPGTTQSPTVFSTTTSLIIDPSTSNPTTTFPPTNFVQTTLPPFTTTVSESTTTTTPEPTTTTPEPTTTTTPEPTTTTPEPTTTTTPVPTTTTPVPTTTTPVPTTTTPEPTTTTTPEPTTTTTPEPTTTTTPEPTTTTPEPTTTTPEPTTTTTPEPTTTTLPPPEMECTGGYTMIGDSCYLYTPNRRNADSAESFCRQQGGALAIIGNAAETEALKRVIKQHVWIGTNDKASEGSFLPNTGYTNWRPNEPNNSNNEDCTTMIVPNLDWNDAQCSSNYYGLCEKAPTVVKSSVGCRPGFVAYKSSCYKLTSENKNYDGGVQECQALGAYPAFINDQEEQDFIRYTFKEDVFIGYNDKSNEGSFQSNQYGAPLFTSWYTNEPNNSGDEDCVELRASLGMTWNDKSCDHSIKTLCETPALTHFCPEGFSFFSPDKTCYIIPVDRTTTQEAVNRCRQMGAELASIDSKEQNDFVAGLATENTLLGMKRVARQTMNDFAKMDNSRLTYHNWSANEPNDSNGEDCVEMWTPRWDWNDMDCSIARKYVCRKPAISFQDSTAVRSF